MRGTCSLGLALAVADLVRLLALALLGIVRWARGETVRALESAGVPVDTGGGAVLRVVAVIWGRVVDLWDDLVRDAVKMFFTDPSSINGPASSKYQ